MTGAAETIYAVSSGRPPAAIAIVRVSGPAAGEALQALAGRRPEARRAVTAKLHDPRTGELLDQALLLWLPGPDSVTGEDVAELHLHGGRAVIDGVLDALTGVQGLREARPGEFTRRAFDNARIDLNEAEGLADLLAAETADQRRAALLSAGGVFSRRVETWRTTVLEISAMLEAAIDFAEEDDVRDEERGRVDQAARQLANELVALLSRPSAERLKDGVRAVVAGPPNSGKSSLVNALSQRDAAIESSIAGTTRDVIEVPVVFSGVPFILVDTAGLRETDDEIEAAGVQRASREMDVADILLWLGDEPPPLHDRLIAISPQCDVRSAIPGRVPVSAKTGENLNVLIAQMMADAQHLLPSPGAMSINERQRCLAAELLERLRTLMSARDLLIRAEEARQALGCCDRLVGRTGVEDMLDTLFGRFCLGK